MCRIVLASYVKRNLSYDLCNKLISPSEKIQNIMYSTIDHFFPARRKMYTTRHCFCILISAKENRFTLYAMKCGLYLKAEGNSHTSFQCI